MMRCTVLAAAIGIALGCSADDRPMGVRMDASGSSTDVNATDATATLDQVIVCAPSVPPAGDDPTAAQRLACTFQAGDHAVSTLGISDTQRSSIPLQHIIVLMQENHSFDQYLGRMPTFGHTDVDGTPDDYSNPDGAGNAVMPSREITTCAPGDPPHQWASVHQAWDSGRMDGFYAASVSGGGHGAWAMGYYDGEQLPFYYWLFSTYAMSDRYFAACLSGTWANRDYLYAGGSFGVRDTGTSTLPLVRTVFDQLDDAGVAWGVYTDGAPRQDCLGWDVTHVGLHPTADLFAGLASGTLPPVTFVDPAGMVDEHPVADIQQGEGWVRSIVVAAQQSPLWPGLALVFTYDEGGGFFDHVPPPTGCIPTPAEPDFDRRGIRVPMVVVSPWARPGYVSHVVHDHTSVLRLVQALYDLPALSGRDANADALLDLFDFTCPHFAIPPIPPPSGTGGCTTM